MKFILNYLENHKKNLVFIFGFAFIVNMGIYPLKGMEKVENTEFKLKYLVEHHFRAEINFYAYSWKCLSGGDASDPYAFLTGTIGKYKSPFVDAIQLILLDPISQVGDIQNLFHLPEWTRGINNVVGMEGYLITVPPHFFTNFADKIEIYVHRATQEAFDRYLDDENFERAIVLANAYGTKDRNKHLQWRSRIIEQLEPVLQKLAKESILLSILDEDLSREKDRKAADLFQLMPDGDLALKYQQSKDLILLPVQMRQLEERLFGNQ